MLVWLVLTPPTRLQTVAGADTEGLVHLSVLQRRKIA